MTRRKTHREAPELAAFLRRMARALVRRAGEGDLEALSALVDARTAIDAAIGQAARALHDLDPEPYSWTDIGRELRISRQAARQMYGRKDTQ